MYGLTRHPKVCVVHEVIYFHGHEERDDDGVHVDYV